MIDTLVALEADPEYTFDVDAITGNTIPMPMPGAGGIAVTDKPSLMDYMNALE